MDLSYCLTEQLPMCSLNLKHCLVHCIFSSGTKVIQYPFLNLHNFLYNESEGTYAQIYDCRHSKKQTAFQERSLRKTLWKTYFPRTNI